MYSISPSQIELFHLRLLLITVKGATSFVDIKTVDGKTHNTFHSACLALGLIEDDAEWDRAMTEREVWMMPRQLRHLFLRLLIYCNPNYLEKLWEEFKDSMSQDFQRNSTLDEALRKEYIEVNTFLLHERSDLRNFPTMPQLTEIHIAIDDEINDEVLPQQHEEMAQIQYKKIEPKTKGYYRYSI